jgi:hypothetical protein
VAGSWPRAPGAFWDKMTTNDDLRELSDDLDREGF